ncbi:multi-sensor Signal transduction histidine kinase [Rhodospirillum rubrum F11]|uniref:histidine kinase n=3 Tax=Rhodospirillum rubrum TaxID=1085 RepID=Q2RVL0_RHORT|nr:PAS domain-containing sensor histidine kinase [Rhodospirillum rubrum]ABC21835.1 multi-sensor signal transduction histidine kinase [Rhodospirillum rubrum ATCC 11170]AEO47535.1 multi-sensor Signal transduction histidine kinase [Rhodospirillum rubrum F11]MBK5953392.1 histidine kinase [Rhodospirillum rubrum]QXG81496.1 PAS domain-containing sensor histidine kinase [Rhodospirillum rubrum]HCF19414.1 PAS domain S-box protein [Rhodospirillum rubrum]
MIPIFKAWAARKRSSEPTAGQSEFDLADPFVAFSDSDSAPPSAEPPSFGPPAAALPPVLTKGDGEGTEDPLVAWRAEESPRRRTDPPPAERRHDPFLGGSFGGAGDAVAEEVSRALSWDEAEKTGGRVGEGEADTLDPVDEDDLYEPLSATPRDPDAPRIARDPPSPLGVDPLEAPRREAEDHREFSIPRSEPLAPFLLPPLPEDPLATSPSREGRPPRQGVDKSDDPAAMAPLAAAAPVERPSGQTGRREPPLADIADASDSEPPEEEDRADEQQASLGPGLGEGAAHGMPAFLAEPASARSEARTRLDPVACGLLGLMVSLGPLGVAAGTVLATGRMPTDRWTLAAAGGLAGLFLVCAGLAAWGIWRHLGGRITRLSAQIEATDQRGRFLGRQARAAKAYLSGVLDGAPLAIVTLDGRGTIIGLNPAAEALFGYPLPRAVGRPLSLLTAAGEDGGPPWPAPTGEEEGPRRVEGRRADGSVFPAELSLRALRRENGGGLVVLFLHDLSAEGGAKSLAESGRAESAFLDVLASELVVPVEAMALALRSSHPDLERVEQALSLLGQIATDVRGFANLEAGRVALEFAPVEVRAVCTRARAAVLAPAAEFGLKVGVSVAPDTPETILGDEALLETVLTNLLDCALQFNALDPAAHAALPGSITLSVRPLDNPPGRLRIEVGCPASEGGRDGLDPASRRRGPILPGARLRLEPVGSRGRTGTILVITRRLAELMGGRVGMESFPGRGTVLWFELDD